MKKNGKAPYSEHSLLEFYDDYFIEKTENTKAEIKYDAVFKIRVNELKAIYIYQNVLVAYIIPFSAFSCEDERKEFLNFIQKKINKHHFE